MLEWPFNRCVKKSKPFNSKTLFRVVFWSWIDMNIPEMAIGHLEKGLPWLDLPMKMASAYPGQDINIKRNQNLLINLNNARGFQVRNKSIP